jgi:YD repeat-containing protein
MRKFAIVTFVLLVLQVATSKRADAQTSPCEQGGTSIVFLAGCTCGPFEPFLFFCSCPKAACAPSASKVEVKNHCDTGSNPVCLADGNTYIEETDLRIPGLGGGLSLVRTWNSQWPSTQTATQVGLFGPNWRSTYEERVFVGSDSYIKYARSDGSFWSLAYSGSNLVPAAPANVTATLVQGSTNWTLTFQNGEKRTFDINSGSLTSIIDRNGNTTTLAYDGTNRLTTVTDAASRHLTFSYANGNSRLVSGVSSDVGISLSYAYDNQGRLTQVTKPDLTTISFQYDPNSFISAVLDSNSKVIEQHTYDSSGRALTSSQANGVNALSLTYVTP